MPVGKKRALISYSYHVEDNLYNGEMNPPFLLLDKTLREYPKGKSITVFYAKKDPGFSRVDKPPGHSDIIGSSIVYWLAVPALLINLVSGLIYAFVNAI